MTFDTVPGVDSNNQFPSVVNEGILSSPEFIAAFAQRVLKGDFGIHIKDYAPAADGNTDDTTKILNAANAAATAGVPLVFSGEKSYVVAGLVLPVGLRMLTNGCKFIKKVNNTTYAIRTSDRTRVDSINFDVTGGGSNDAGVYVNGSDTIIDRIKVTSLNPDQLGANALLVGDISTTKSNIRINSIELTGFRSPMRTLNVDKGTFENAVISTFTTAVYVINTKNTDFNKFLVTGTSPSATGANGQNAMLMEAQANDYACTNVTFNDWLVDGAPEHSFRIGGALSVLDITFNNCISRNAGNAGAGATGGGAFKVLGAIGHLHYGIHFNNCTAEDANTDGSGTNNFSQFNIGDAKGVRLVSPVVRKRNKTYSAQAALFMSAVTNVEVTNPDFSDTKTFAIWMGKDSTNTSGDPVAYVKFIGGFIHSALTHALEFTPDTTTIKNVSFEGTSIIGNSTVVRGARFNAIGSGGLYTNVSLDVSYELNATLPGSGEPALVTPTAGVLLRYRGPVYGYTITADNGSIMMDTTNGLVKIRKANAWVTL